MLWRWRRKPTWALGETSLHRESPAGIWTQDLLACSVDVMWPCRWVLYWTFHTRLFICLFWIVFSTRCVINQTFTSVSSLQTRYSSVTSAFIRSQFTGFRIDRIWLTIRKTSGNILTALHKDVKTEEANVANQLRSTLYKPLIKQSYCPVSDLS